MKIAALSDFHIGASERGDVFRHSDAAFHDYLDLLEDRHDRIVLLGDIFQAEYGAILSTGTKRRELRRAQQRASSLWSRLQRAPYTYMHGNHDSVARELEGALETLAIEADGYRIFFVHGHQYDPLLRRLYPLAQLSTWFSGRVRQAGFGRLSDWLEHQDVELKRKAFDGESGPYVQAATGLLLEHQADLVVMGHTHVPQRIELAGGLYANTGTCSLGQRMHLSIDTRARTVEMNQS